MLPPGIRMIERPGALHFYDGHRVVSLTCADEVRSALAAVAQAPVDAAHLGLLAELADTDIETARQLVDLLASLAVVDTSELDPADTGLDAPVGVRAAAEFSRATVGGDISRAQARRRLATTLVHVVCADDGDSATQIAAQLRESGLNAAPATVRGDLVIAAGDLVVSDVAMARHVNDLSLRQGFAWYPIGGYDGAVTRVGPLILPGQTACYECLISRLASNVEYAGLYRDVVAPAPAASGPAALRSWAVSIAALGLVRWIAGEDPTQPGLLHTLAATDLSIRSATVYRVPRCRSCSAPDYLPAVAPWEDADVR